MAANRPKRHRPENPVEHDDNKWTLKEKRRIQRALLKFKPNEVEKIAKIVVTKKPREVKAYLDRMEERLKQYAKNRPKEAIECWSTVGADLVSCEVKDYSEVLSEVMAVAAHLEGPELVHEGGSSPNYNSIYQYISATLAGEDLPFLGKLECSIVLDLMHGLVDTLRTHDSNKQQEIMLQKYHLLTSKIDLNNTMAHLERCRRAINNDYTDFHTKNKDGLASSTEAAVNITVKPSAKASSITSTVGPILPPGDLAASTGCLSTSTGNPSTSTNSSLSTAGQSIGTGIPSTRKEDICAATSGKKGRGRPSKRTQILPCTSVPLPSKKSKSSENVSSSDQVKSAHSSADLANSCSNYTSEKMPSTNIDIHSSKQCGSQLEPSANRTSNEITIQNTNLENNHNAVNGNDTTGRQENIPKKPALFTLNPFCIPIDLLKFPRLVPSDVTFKPVMRTHQKVLQDYPYRKPRNIPDNQKKLDNEKDVICIDDKAQNVVRGEKFISITRQEIADKNN